MNKKREKEEGNLYIPLYYPEMRLQSIAYRKDHYRHLLCNDCILKGRVGRILFSVRNSNHICILYIRFRFRILNNSNRRFLFIIKKKKNSLLCIFRLMQGKEKGEKRKQKNIISTYSGRFLGLLSLFLVWNPVNIRYNFQHPDKFCNRLNRLNYK